MRAFKSLFKYFNQYKWYFILGLVFLIIVDLAQLYIPRIIKYAIDEITKKSILQAKLIHYALWIVGLALVVAFFRFLWQYCIFGVVIRIEKDLRNYLFSHLQKLELKFFRKHKIGDLMAHSTNDIEAVRRALGFGIIIIVDVIVLGSLSFVFMCLISLRLTLYAIIPLPFLFFIVLRFGKLIHHRFEQVQESFSSLTAHTRENIEGIRVIKGYNQEKGEVQKFKEKAQQYVDKNIHLFKVWSAFHPLIFFFANIGQGIVLLIGGKEVILNTISMGDFVAFYSYLGMLMWPIIGIGWVTNLLQRGAASMERINRLLRVAPEIKEEKEHKKPTKWKIEFRDLSFSYNGREILKGINFSIQEGESLGIVGEIGSGKSTLVSLIPRLFEPNKGEIRIDGIPIKEIAFSMLRRNIGFVPQDTFLFSDTIKNNIAFGQPEASESEIYRVARLAEIHEEIMSFPSKYEEIVGERGITLSGGQRQRIAIARTILTNPKVLILDNALSSVDIEKEINIIQNLKKEFKGRTLIIISHRLRSIIGLDKIIVLDYGKIVEEGTHNELMENKGLYFNLFKTQEVEERWK